ncbi:MAG: polysaccharide biosynthesis tyrosine autokinase [Scytonematopsis contorta HA4267-MV1]|jgi:capsular exopolysaccharide synthesis family protein|nr:polysaccharide biosynthesis tyrosine autokinase [Scytonematopsis contorta HA4267-MV1]
MEKFSSQPMNSQHQKNSLATSPQPTVLRLAEAEENDQGLRNLLGFLKRRGLVIVGVATVIMGGMTYLTLTQKAEYQGSFRLLVEPVKEENTNLNKLTDTNTEVGGKQNLDYETQIQVLKSPELMNEIANNLKVKYPEINYDYLARFLIIQRLNQTKVIEVTYRSDDKKKIKPVLDRVAETYLKYSLEKRQSKLRQGIQFVDKELPAIKNRVESLQKELQIFRQKYNFIEPNIQSEEISYALRQLRDERLKVNQDLAKARANLNYLQQNNGKLTVLKDSASYQQLLAQLRQVEAQIAFEKTRFQEENPAMQTLIEKRDNLIPLVEQEAQGALTTKLAEVTNELQALEQRSQVLAKSEQRFTEQTKLYPVLARKYTELQRDLQLATESLNRFLSTRENLQIDVAKNELPWQLIQEAVEPSKQSSPDVQRNLLLAIIASSLLGTAAGIVMEKLDNTFHNIDTLKAKLEPAILGAIPLDKRLQNASVSTRIPDTAKSLESLRVIQTNLQLIGSESPVRSVVVSSFSTGDGASTVAFHMAQVASSMGQRVLLVDANMRQPQVHSLSNLRKDGGLSDLLSGEISLDEAFKRVSSTGELHVITAGSIPPDPAKLLSSGKMKMLMEDFHHHFDLVIYDAPSLEGLADTSLLAPYTDGLLMVVRMDKTDCSVVQQALDNLKMSRINILGVVANGYNAKVLG